jgi:cytochrome c553
MAGSKSNNLRSALTIAISILILSSCSSEPKSEGGKPSAEEIETVYGFKCALCHGKDGNSLIKIAPNLTESTLDLEQRISIISNGKNTMPPQKDVLDEATILGLAEYVATFRK